VCRFAEVANLLKVADEIGREADIREQPLCFVVPFIVFTMVGAGFGLAASAVLTGLDTPVPFP